MIHYTKKNDDGNFLDDNGEVLTPSGKGHYFQTHEAFIIFESEDEKQQYVDALPKPEPGVPFKTVEEQVAEIKEKMEGIESKVEEHEEKLKDDGGTKK